MNQKVQERSSRSRLQNIKKKNDAEENDEDDEMKDSFEVNVQSQNKSKCPAKKSNQKVTSTRKQFRCTICNYVTNVKARFTKHVKYHSMPLIKCEHCDFKTPYKWNLDRHYKNHNGEGSLCCPLCNFKCDIKQSLTVHVQNHHASVPDNIGELIKKTLGYGDATTATTANMTTSTSVYPKDFLRRGVKRSFSMTSTNSKKLKTTGNLFSNRKLNQFKCQLCNFTAWSEISLSRHVSLYHNQRKQSLLTAKPKPMPNLIPIPSKSQILNSSGQRTQCPDLTAEISESRNCKPGSSLSLSGLKNDSKVVTNTNSRDSFEEKSAFLEYFALKPKEESLPDDTNVDDIANENTHNNSTGGSISRRPIKNSAPRRRTSFFEKLTKKLVANSKSDLESSPGSSANSITITSNSTRCQYCRHRCKSSVDLIGHLGQCPVAKNYLEDENEEMDNEYSTTMGSLRNKVFVWNDMSPNYTYETKQEQMDETNFSDLTGYETSPGIGSIHLKEGDIQVDDEDKADSVTKSRKVYKCPQDGFWATTASRFHVHIVGHYNLKPFECSQCSYRSNWRWDITKHIKLKTHRDPAHSKAKVLLTHESGQRNYRKYDRYLVAMDVKYSADSKLPDCSTVASKRPDVELSPSSLVISPMSSPSASHLSRNNPNLKMPKLTKAPGYISQSVINTSTVKMESMLHVTHPPTLKPITSATSISRSRLMLSGGEILQNIDSLGKEITVTPVIKVKQEQGLDLKIRKKPLWKCKKCPFKHSNKDVVVIHIRHSHKPKNGEAVSILNQNNLIPVDDDSNDDEENDQEVPPILDTEREDFSYNAKGGLFKCKICSFVGTTLNVIKKHNLENHPDTQFICAYCSQPTQSRREMLQHMKIHEADKVGEDNPSNNVEGIISPEEIRFKPRGSGSNGEHTYKKYHCLECPYVTDSKGQFLYHKQFHVTNNDAPYKCSVCSYHVSHKHLLHQHLRVHAPVVSSPKNQEFTHDEQDIDMPDIDEDDWEKQPSNELENQSLKNENHPTVLLWKGGKPYRVFRCRFCPTVYHKLNDLTEHEENHNKPILYSPAPFLSEAMNLSVNSRKNNSGNLPSNLSMTPPVFGYPTHNQPKTLLYFCDLCPGRFFYEKELRIHRTFHIKTSEFNCQLCTYSARQQVPHLMSHMRVHSSEYQMKTQALLAKYPKAPPIDLNSHISTEYNVPISITPEISMEKKGTGIHHHFKADASIDCKLCPAKFNTMVLYLQHAILHAGSEITIEPENIEPPSSVPVQLPEIVLDTVEQSLKTNNSAAAASTLSEQKDDDSYLGNPLFTYPTYVKNGRVKSKRYKCFKCPSAFEKRDQYRVHIGLHGSNQKYKCFCCDYAVTYYANYIQHLRKHENQPNYASNEATIKDDSNNVAFKCGRCPFRTFDKEELTIHKSHHMESSNEKILKYQNAHKCLFCDFVINTRDLLTDHIRLHFHANNKSSDNLPDMHMYIIDEEIVAKGKELRTLYSEKENLNDAEDFNTNNASSKGEEVSTATVIDLRLGLPVSFLNENEEKQKSGN